MYRADEEKRIAGQQAHAQQQAASGTAWASASGRAGFTEGDQEAIAKAGNPPSLVQLLCMGIPDARDYALLASSGCFANPDWGDDARECEAATRVRILCAKDLAKLARDAA